MGEPEEMIRADRSKVRDRGSAKGASEAVQPVCPLAKVPTVNEKAAPNDFALTTLLCFITTAITAPLNFMFMAIGFAIGEAWLGTKVEVFRVGFAVNFAMVLHTGFFGVCWIPVDLIFRRRSLLVRTLSAVFLTLGYFAFWIWWYTFCVSALSGWG